MTKFFLRNKAFLIFGMMFVFFSAPGQTFLMSLFFEPIFQEMNVSRSLFAGIYSAATLTAALLLNPVGKILDRRPPRKSILGLTTLMAIGCCLLASAHNIVVLFVGFFLVRWIGQGAYGVIAVTTMSRAFHKNRGKALAIINQGLPLSEIIYPPLAIFLLATIGWRWTLVIFGILNLLVMFPMQRILLKRSPYKHGESLPGEKDLSKTDHRPAAVDHTVREMLKDPKCYLILIPACFPTMIVAGMFFHQSTLMHHNNWHLGLAAWALFYYAIFKAVASLGIGPYLDRKNPVIPFVWFLITLGLSAITAGIGGSAWMMGWSYGLAGIALGISAPATNYIWTYFYGTKHIGEIKSFYDMTRNSSTALTPLVMALGMDAGFSIGQVLIAAGILTLTICILPLILLKKLKRPFPDQKPQATG